MGKFTEKVLRKIIHSLAAVYYQCFIKRKSKSSYIPASGKKLGREELFNMIDASLDMWLTTGRFNDAFEKKFSEFLGVKYTLTTNSGSSANLLALSALTSPKLKDKALKPGDEVITVAAGFPTTVNPIIQNGLIPVFVDCKLDTYNIDETKIEEALSPKTKAIFLAHTLGNMFDIEQILQICQKHNLWLIEDSCDALGAKWGEKYAGTIGHVGTFSFYPAHHITMGEGGAVVTNDPILHKIIASFRDWGRDCWCKPGCDNSCQNRFKFKLGNLPSGYDHKYTYSHIGYNLKITDWQAGIGLAQLDKLPDFLAQRTKNAQFLADKLSDLQNYLLLPQGQIGTTSSWFGFPISVKPNNKFTKQELVEYLEKNNIGTRQLFAGNILRQPMITTSGISLRIGNSKLIRAEDLDERHYALLPNSDFIMNNTFWVGCFPALGEKELSQTTATIRRFIEEKYK